MTAFRFLLGLWFVPTQPLVDGAHLRYVARRAGIPEALFQSVAWVESQNALTVGAAHACTRAPKWRYCAWGRFQLKWATATRYCGLSFAQLRRYGPNVDCAATVLRALYDETGSWYGAVLHYYNPSEGPDAQAYAGAVCRGALQ